MPAATESCSPGTTTALERPQLCPLEPRVPRKLLSVVVAAKQQQQQQQLVLLQPQISHPQSHQDVLEAGGPGACGSFNAAKVPGQAPAAPAVPEQLMQGTEQTAAVLNVMTSDPGGDSSHRLG